VARGEGELLRQGLLPTHFYSILAALGGSPHFNVVVSPSEGDPFTLIFHPRS